MFKYELKDKKGKVTHSKKIKDDVSNPWSSKMERLEAGWGKLTVSKEDVTAEEAAKEAKNQARKDARTALKAMDLDSATPRAILKELVKAIL